MTQAASLLWEERKTTEFQPFDASGAIVILPIGSTEQHGPHLPVSVDTMLVTEVALRAAKIASGRARVIVLPALWVSLAEHHMGFGGTLTLDFDTFHAVLANLVGSLRRQGFRKILLLNGHGGNTGALAVIVDLLSRRFDVPIATATYWHLAGREFAAILEAQTGLLHACEAESSMVMHLQPSLVDEWQVRSVDAPACGFLEPTGVYRWRSIAHWSCNGTVGVPRLATAQKGALLLAAAATALADRLASDDIWPEERDEKP